MSTKTKTKADERKPVTFTTAPRTATVENGSLIIRKSGFPLHPIYDQLVADLDGDPAQRPVLSMRARVEARAKFDPRTAEELVWLFEKETDGEPPPAA